ncbi:Ig-like domain-containing protein [Myxococcus xanthus]|uniref:Ig-like domain-containing protein n=2 Tax=Myxococcus xanthus TaxID=34 RepID=UPI001F2A4B49|nr:Ig-like domain-containing protein [Myxococcus xanthus]
MRPALVHFMTSKTCLTALLGFGVLTACINVPDVVEPPELPDSGTPYVRLQLAGGATHVRDTVTVHIETNGESPDDVELLLDGAPLGHVTAPTEFAWDTSAHSEGQHSLTARVRLQNATWQSEPLVVTIDPTPPTIALRAPADGEEDVSASHPIRVEFSEALHPDSLAASSVELLVNGESVARTLSLSESQRALEIQAGVELPLPRDVEVKLTGVRDLAGNPVAAPSASWSWSVPAWLPVGPRDGLVIEEGAATLSRLALREHAPQAAIVAFRVDNGVGVRRWTGQTWERLGSVLKPASTTADFHFSNDGEPVVAFSHFFKREDEELGLVDVAETAIHRWAGAEWERFALTASDWDTAWPTNWPEQREAPSFAFDTAGTPFLAHGTGAYSGFGCQGDVHLAVQTQSDGNWLQVDSPSRGAPEQCGIVSTPTLSLNSSRLPVVAWAEVMQEGGTPTQDARIFVKQRTAVGWNALGGAIRHHSGGTFASQPVLKVSAADVPVLAWKESNPSGSGTTATDIYVRQWEDRQWKALGGPLSAAPGNTPADSPALALDSEGTPVIAWIEEEGTARHVHVRTWTGDDWLPLNTAPSAIPKSNGAATVSLQLDTDGTPWVAWDASPGGGPVRIFVYRFNR